MIGPAPTTLEVGMTKWIERVLHVSASAVGLIVFVGCFALNAERAGQGIVYVDSFDLSCGTCGLGKRIQSGMAVAGNPLVVCGKT